MLLCFFLLDPNVFVLVIALHYVLAFIHEKKRRAGACSKAPAQALPRRVSMLDELYLGDPPFRRKEAPCAVVPGLST